MRAERLADAVDMTQLSLFDAPESDRSHLSLRARTLLALERLFPPATGVPQHEGEHTAFEQAKAAGSYAAFIDELDGVSDKRVLDFGCGWGGESMWLAERAAFVDGCDVDLAALTTAEKQRRAAGVRNLAFARCDVQKLPYADRSFDAIFSTDVFEHVMDVPAMLRELHRVLQPGGSLITRFGPLFYSPYGYHLCWATRVPFAHLLFGLRPILEVRNLKRPTLWASTWRDTGLNGLTFEGFRDAVLDSGLSVIRLERLAVKGLDAAARMPGLGRLLTFGVECHLRRT